MRLFQVLSLGIVVMTVLSACEFSDQTETRTETHLRPVRSMVIESFIEGTTRTFSGTSRSGLESNLSFRVSGSIESLDIDVGDQLKPGQVIATLDPAQYQLEVQQARANLSQSEANLRNAEANFERLKGLYENNNISRNELDAARAQAESLNAQVSAARKTLELSQLNLSYTRLKSINDCNVAALQAEENENVSAGQTIVSVTCGDTREVTLDIPESMIASIYKGMKASVLFSAIANQAFNAVVTEVSVATHSGAAYPVTVELKDDVPEFRTGLAAQVSFSMVSAATASGTIMVPAVAVGEDTEGQYVFILEPTEQQGEAMIRRQAVSIGELTTQGLEITQGLKEGDRIVTAGVNVVREGLRVLVN